jgi:hypothetical protein
MNLRHPGSKIVTDDIVLVSSLAWNDGLGRTLDRREKDWQQQVKQGVDVMITIFCDFRSFFGKKNFGVFHKLML